MASKNYQAWSVVTASTTAFTVCFMVWMMFAVIGIPIKETLKLNETQFGILVALPVLTGSLIRLPLGMWTDRFGGRIVFFILMLSTVVPIWLIGQATEYWQFLVTGLFVGIAGGSFTVGIAYCARWFPKNRQGLAMGIFGAGNTGAAVNKLIAPSIVVAYGWTAVPQVYAVTMLVTALAFWMFSYTDAEHSTGGSHVTVGEQLAALKDPTVWRYSQYYSIVFGGYVALSLWMTKYYISEYGFDIRLAALFAAAFIIPGGVLRAVGGWFSDRFGAHTRDGLAYLRVRFAPERIYIRVLSRNADGRIRRASEVDRNIRLLEALDLGEGPLEEGRGALVERRAALRLERDRREIERRT